MSFHCAYIKWSLKKTVVSVSFIIDFKNFSILMLGRLLGGVATSLLFSVFEAWLIGAHSSANVMTHLGKSFSLAQYGNSIVAILAGQSKYCYCLI